MTLRDTFCSSPWFHMRITPSGTYEYCRWKHNHGLARVHAIDNIQNVTPTQYFQNTMSLVRASMLQGQPPRQCESCQVMEQHGKVSGRQRQLLKSGVLLPYFEKSLVSSPMREKFDYSAANNGHSQAQIQDWQIDLGNYCNSACVFCDPEYSSRLAAEHLELGLISSMPTASWCDDPDALDRFIKDLESNNELCYLHFIGGETLITPAFKKILQALVNSNQASNITVGFTTNLTVWMQDIVDLLMHFKQVNLGMSIETLTKTNDYVRWPSDIDRVKMILDRWVDLGRLHEWLMQIRITPTCLTVHELDTVYEYAWQNGIAVESCNFLERPHHMRINVLPEQQKQAAIERLICWLATHGCDTSHQVINTRDPSHVRSQIVQDAHSYLDYLSHCQDESASLPDLVRYLKALESRRGNTILDYLPEYEKLLRDNGYQT